MNSSWNYFFFVDTVCSIRNSGYVVSSLLYNAYLFWLYYKKGHNPYKVNDCRAAESQKRRARANVCMPPARPAHSPYSYKCRYYVTSADRECGWLDQRDKSLASRNSYRLTRTHTAAIIAHRLLHRVNVSPTKQTRIGIGPLAIVNYLFNLIE